MSTSLWGDFVELSGTDFSDHYAIANLVLSFVAFFGILSTLFSSRHDYNNQGRDAAPRDAAFKSLRWSMVCYLLSYSLLIIDIFLHEKAVYVQEGYFFATVFQDGWWQIADLLLLTIICRITRYQFPLWGERAVLHAIWRFWCLIFLTILTALALYRWAVSTAYLILELNGVSSTWTARFPLEAASLATGYQIMYLLLSTFVLVFTSYYLSRRTRFREKPDMIEGQLLAIVIILWIRSITMADIVVKYTLHGESQPAYLATVKEALYGLPTVIIYILLNRLNGPNPISVAKSDILREGRRMARKELKRRRIDAANGGPPLPTPTQLFAEIESNPLSYLPDQIQTKISLLPEHEVQETFSRHIEDILKLREKI